MVVGMGDEVHDFYGPYSIHVHHDGHAIVFLKNKGAYSLDSERLFEIVNNKISELETETKKWCDLKEKIVLKDKI